MITQNNMKQAMDMAGLASYKDQQLSPVPQTYLSGLVESLAGVEESGTAESIMALSMQTNTATGSHSELQKEYVKNTARIMSTIIDVARNQVNPKIKEVLADIEARRARYAEEAARTNKTVKQLEIAPLYTDMLFLELIGPYVTVSRPAPTGDELTLYGITLENLATGLTQEEVDSLLITGSTALDERIAGVVAAANTAGKGAIYDAMNFKRSLADLVTSFVALTSVLNGKMEKASALIEDVNDEARIAHVRELIGFEIHKKIDRLTNAVKSNMLIASPMITGENTYSNEVTVIGPVYRNWLKELGGSPEAVIGYCITTDGLYNPATATAMYNDPARYVAVYQKQMEHGKAMATAADQKIVRDALTSIVGRQIRSTYEEDAAIAAKQTLLKDCLEKTYHGSDQLVPYVRGVICKVFTEGDDVKTILTEIDSNLERMGDNPDMKQAVYIAVNRLVGRWVANQIKLGA